MRAPFGTVRHGASIALLATLAACGPGGSTHAPPDLRGVWVGEDPRYADRTMEILADTIRFGGAGGRVRSHAILGVRTGQEGSVAQRVTVVYESHGAEYELSLRRRSDGTLELVNQPGVTWRRRAGPGS